MKNLEFIQRAELESRAEIQYETYAKVRNIEAKTMIDMAGKQIIPAVIKAVQGLADSMKSVSRHLSRSRCKRSKRTVGSNVRFTCRNKACFGRN